MSQFLLVQTKISSLDCLGKALKNMGYTLAKGFEVHAYQGTKPVDYVISEFRSGGFVKQGDFFNFVGDFYNTGVNQNEFMAQLQKNYALEVIRHAVWLNNTVLSDIKINADGSLDLEIA